MLPLCRRETRRSHAAVSLRDDATDSYWRRSSGRRQLCTLSSAQPLVIKFIIAQGRTTPQMHLMFMMFIKSCLKYCYCYCYYCLHITGRVFNEVWRVVVRCDSLGDSDVCPWATVWWTDGRPGCRQLCPLLPRGRLRRGGSRDWHGEGRPRSTCQLSPWDLQPHGGVLEPRGVAETYVPRGAHVSAEEEHGIQRGWRTANTVTERCTVCLTAYEIVLVFVGIKSVIF